MAVETEINLDETTQAEEAAEKAVSQETVDADLSGNAAEAPAVKAKRRKGPLSPEEMIDVRNQELRVDEELVERLVEEAKADYAANLLEPMWALTNPPAVRRHRRRYIRVMGELARFKSGILGGLMSLGVPLGIFGFLWWNDEFGWFWDIFFSLGFGFMLSIVVGVWRGYREAFRKVYVVERADFTDVGYVTALVRVWLPALGFYKRPEVWRGDNGRNGIGNPNAFVALSAGQDVIIWHEMPEMDTPEWEEFLDKDVLCDVEPGPRVTEFRTPLDYFDLAPDVRTCDGISVKHRRAWCRDLQRSGQDFEAWRKGALGFLEGNWPWFYAAGCAVVGVFILMLAM